ncbi:transpeptidase family protein [Chitinophagaceae bacterium LB-8]|uniref:Transpeptidase family protein n=1 Tax=Paraflavisolibacter caeni TaxID=2982496 RepID=A0A9X3B6U6_9BACT|nr:penicillin-binding protein [Paraflavisolibacter caeni]MCU7547746.1 transpeptidase family protein [Paraflavisolibacter caeni]
MEVKSDILWRVYLSFIGIVVLSLVVMGRAFYIQRFEGDYWRGLSDSLHQKLVELDAERGTIYSEDGQMLSTSIPFFDVYMDFGAEGLRDKNGKRFRENIDSFAIALSNFFEDKSTYIYKKELQLAYNEKNRYYLLKKNLSFDQYKAFREFPLVRLGRNKSGVIAEVKTKRLNPFGILAKRTIGLARENAQNVGLERTYDTMLKGATGRRLVRFIAGGAAVPVEGYEIEAENGKDVITTLDVNIQDIAENALMKMMVQSEAQWGTCIVMETKTGKIKAIANLGHGKDGAYDENLNYALQTNEPGSTIKLATLLAVLDAGHSKISDLVDVGSEGRAFVGVRNVTDAERAPKPVLTVREIFAHSSNVGFSKLAFKAFAEKPEDFKNYLHRFHLDRKSGIGLVGEEPPVIPRWKRNKEGLHAMLTMSFGYAIEVSPLQTLMLYNAVANGGKMMRPYLVNKIQSNGLAVKEFLPEVIDENICKPKVIADARKCMEAVVIEGTAKDVFKDVPFSVAGKTGTAHVAGGDVKYYDGVYQASFVGYFPADQPEYTCIVVVKTKPHAAIHYGGQLAAPVFKEVATKLYAMYVQRKKIGPVQLIPDSSLHAYAGYGDDIKNILLTVGMKYKDSARRADWNTVYTNPGKPVVKAAEMNSKTIPDVRNMTLKDALYVLENRNVKVAVKGRGKVVAQDIIPGTRITKNQTITLLLN